MPADSQATTLNNSFRECAKIDNHLTRLTCFDQLAKTLVTSSEKTKTHGESIEADKSPVLIQKENSVISTTKDKAQFIDNFGSSHLKKDKVNDEEQSVILLL